jgi:hypothetical protein
LQKSHASPPEIKTKIKSLNRFNRILGIVEKINELKDRCEEIIQNLVKKKQREMRG